MADPPRSLSVTPDFYSIFGMPKSTSIKDLCRVFVKWSPTDKSPSNKSDAGDKSTAINESDKSFHGKEEEELTISEPMTPLGNTQHQSLDELLLFSHSYMPRSMSSNRRCQTRTPSPASLSRNTSRRSATPTPLSTSTSRRSISETEIPTPLATTTSRSNFTLEADILKTLSRNMSKRNTTTPIVYSQSTAALKKPPPVEKKLECTLEELFDGCVKKIKITRNAIENGIIVQEEERLRIEVKPGWTKGTKITFEGKGDEKPGYLPADVVFLIEEKRHPLYRREGFDLEIGVEIPLVKALTGCSITVPLLGGEKMGLSFENIIYPGFEKVIKGQGMPNPKQGRRGDLRIKFLVNFSLELSDEQRAEASSILQGCS